MRLLVVILASLLTSCGPHDPAAPVPVGRNGAAVTRDPDWFAGVLPCVVRTVVDTANATPEPLDTAQLALEVSPLGGSASRAARLILAVAARPELRAPRADLLAVAARNLAELGQLQDARALAEQAVAAEVPNEHDPSTLARQTAALVLAWSGDPDAALAMAGTDPMSVISAAEGMGRAGDRAGAARALARLTADPMTASPSSRGRLLQARVWAGDLDGARALLAAESDPRQRPMLLLSLADAAAASHHPEAIAVTDAAIADVEALARTEPSDAHLSEIAVWNDLVATRERLGGPGAAAPRRALDTWLLAGPERASRRDLLGLNATRAQRANQPADADRLLAATPASERALAQLEIAMLRNQPDVAVAALADYRRARAGWLAGPADKLPFGTSSVAEVDMFLQLAEHPAPSAVVDRFRALVCAPR